MHTGHAFGPSARLHVGPQDHPALKDLAQPRKIRAGNVTRLSSVTLPIRFTHPAKYLTPLTWLCPTGQVMTWRRPNSGPPTGPAAPPG
jgi:hypothetical protein